MRLSSEHCRRAIDWNRTATCGVCLNETQCPRVNRSRKTEHAATSGAYTRIAAVSIETRAALSPVSESLQSGCGRYRAAFADRDVAARATVHAIRNGRAASGLRPDATLTKHSLRHPRVHPHAQPRVVFYFAPDESAGVVGKPLNGVQEMPANNPFDSTDPTDPCRKVRPNSARIGKQQLLYAEGISAQTVGSKHLHMQLATLPPMLRARAHKHEAHERSEERRVGKECRSRWSP